MNGTYTAVVDRIVDGKTAVLLLEDGDEVIDQIDLPVERLVKQAQHEGVVLTVEMVAGEIDSIQYEPQETRERRESAKERLDRLSTPLKDRNQDDIDALGNDEY
ncbi:hypothetical protein JCM18237_28160 [Halorubrum luteum]